MKLSDLKQLIREELQSIQELDAADDLSRLSRDVRNFMIDIRGDTSDKINEPSEYMELIPIILTTLAPTQMTPLKKQQFLINLAKAFADLVEAEKDREEALEDVTP